MRIEVEKLCKYIHNNIAYIYSNSCSRKNELIKLVDKSDKQLHTYKNKVIAQMAKQELIIQMLKRNGIDWLLR